MVGTVEFTRNKGSQLPRFFLKSIQLGGSETGLELMGGGDGGETMLPGADKLKSTRSAARDVTDGLGRR